MSQPTDDNVAVLTWACPSIPEALNDRAADNWEPLLAIADLAGSAKRDSRKVTFIVPGGAMGQVGICGYNYHGCSEPIALRKEE
jgi:putative DNA primase/helicase